MTHHPNHAPHLLRSGSHTEPPMFHTSDRTCSPQRRGLVFNTSTHTPTLHHPLWLQVQTEVYPLRLQFALNASMAHIHCTPTQTLPATRQQCCLPQTIHAQHPTPTTHAHNCSEYHHPSDFGVPHVLSQPHSSTQTNDYARSRLTRSKRHTTRTGCGKD
uniref:Uncharacterized protein n=1 Tax=Mesocestoides corti TaxID=53468 RepID=A0A5K3F031_MESCO